MSTPLPTKQQQQQKQKYFTLDSTWSCCIVITTKPTCFRPVWVRFSFCNLGCIKIKIIKNLKVPITWKGLACTDYKVAWHNWYNLVCIINTNIFFLNTEPYLCEDQPWQLKKIRPNAEFIFFIAPEDTFVAASAVFVANMSLGCSPGSWPQSETRIGFQHATLSHFLFRVLHAENSAFSNQQDADIWDGDVYMHTHTNKILTRPDHNQDS